ncbi:hypothetical protein [Catellatospora sp. IY07-71]|uniref:Cap15 family cyclic dinucleotide receptor domain-containing protein n=1 Tax=Catellatospora sp. IY07-71 TaxID=2728827 RepID=UPI001BB3274B|nr:hypothetical protein [Catellatospora sp. IY07-71]
MSKHLIALLPAAGTVALTLWDGWLWRIAPLNKLVHRPRIDGLWQLTITPTSESHIPPGGNRGPILAFMTVSQSYWSIHVRLCTVESVSLSRSFFWEHPNGADTERLVFVYENEPRHIHQHRSVRHIGSCVLDIVGKQPDNFMGTYFTDRYTKGDMEFELIDRTKDYASFASAQKYVETLRNGR